MWRKRERVGADATEATSTEKNPFDSVVGKAELSISIFNKLSDMKLLEKILK